MARVFGKEHKNVLRDIGHILEDVDPEFNRLNFEPVTFKDKKVQGDSYYYVRVTQVDGEEAWASPIYVSGK